MKYSSEIVGWGNDALDFIDLNFVIIFNDTAPPELAEIAILHKPAELLAEPEVGDMLMFGNKAYTITAIGDEALKTLKELGHCTLNFTGGSEAERPGCIMLEGEPLTREDVQAGLKIEIY